MISEGRSHDCSPLVCVLGMLLLSVGCGGSEVELGRVHGRVMMDGKPVPRAQVTFIPEGPGRSASGLANEQGEYEMEYSPTDEGALVGPVSVQISTLTIDHPETIPARYNVNTELKRTVEPGTNQIDFDLQSK